MAGISKKLVCAILLVVLLAMSLPAPQVAYAALVPPGTCYEKYHGGSGDGFSFLESSELSLDTGTQTPTLTTPATSSTDDSSVAYGFTLPEAATSGTAKMTFTRTGGMADGYSPQVITFNYTTAATHTGSLVGTDLSTSDNVTEVTNAGGVAGENDALVDGAVYSVKIEYQDALGNAAANATNTSFTYDVTAPVISSVLPSSSSAVNNTQVSYTLSEAIASGTITWTRTGGTADGSSPHAQALTGGELNSGAHNDITLTNNPTLVDGAVYTIAFDVTDAAGNVAAQVTSTSVTYDITSPTVSSTSPADGATGVAIGTAVSVTFSDAMDESTINTSSFSLDSISGSVSYDSSTYTATFTPAENLSYGATYTATLSTAITDAAGNPLAAAYSWSFTTVTPPQPGPELVPEPEPAPEPEPETPPSASSFGMNDSSPISDEPVNLATGNYICQHQDIFIPARGLPLSVIRSYNSLDNYNGPFGHGWTFNYNMNLTVLPDGDVIVATQDGRWDVYAHKDDRNFTPPYSVYTTLAKNTDGTYTLKQKNGTIYSFNLQGKLSNIVEKNGNQLSCTCDNEGKLVRVTDASGRSLAFTYNDEGRITRITDWMDRTWNYAYDTQGDLVQYIDPIGNQVCYTYNVNHWMTSITDARGNQVVANVYDEQGRVVSQVNALGSVTRFEYDTQNRRATETDPLGQQAVYAYDEHFFEVSRTDALGNTTQYYAYDENGNRTSITDANGHTTYYRYDSRGNIIQVTDALGNVTTLAYDLQNNLTSRKDALGRTTTYAYDGRGNLVSVKDAEGSTMRLSHDSFGHITSRTNANGYATSFSYDKDGSLISVTDPLGNTVSYTYDAIGQLITRTDPRGRKTTFAYDGLGRLTYVINPLGNRVTITYDANGNRTSITDTAGNPTTYSYDALNRITKVNDAIGGVVSYTYDTGDNMVAMTDANGHTTKYAYDLLNRLNSVTDPLGNVISYGYDPVGNAITFANAKGNVISYGYDAFNRLTEIVYSDGTHMRYAYDPVGNRLTMTDNSGTTSYEYDKLNRLVSVIGPDGNIVAYNYDGAGNRTELAYPDGKTVSYTYDAIGRLVRVIDWAGEATQYTYDANGNSISVSYPNGIRTECAYDEGDRLVKLVNKSRENVISSFEYTLDAVGNRVKVMEQFAAGWQGMRLKVGMEGLGDKVNTLLEKEVKQCQPEVPLSISYEYDKLYRLTRVAYPFGMTTSYMYDPMGNRTSMSTRVGDGNFTADYVYDAGDRLLQAGGLTYVYDANGNLTQKNKDGLTIASYTYDVANRLTEASLLLPTPKPSGILDKLRAIFDKLIGKSPKVEVFSVSFSYDGDGNRINKSVSDGERAEFIRYVWDVGSSLPQIITEADGRGTSSYLRGTGLIARRDPQGNVSYYHSDGLGSVRNLTDSEGQTKSVYLYDAFGQPYVTAGSTDNDFLFTGEQMDSDTGLIYLRARYYDPSTGRFITTDPVCRFASNIQSLNRYVYVQNNPINLFDPSGCCPRSRQQVDLTDPRLWRELLDPISLTSLGSGRYVGGLISTFGALSIAAVPIGVIVITVPVAFATGYVVGYEVSTAVIEAWEQFGLSPSILATSPWAWSDLTR